MKKKLITTSPARRIRIPFLGIAGFERYLNRRLTTPERRIIATIANQRSARPIVVIDPPGQNSAWLLHDYVKYRLAIGPQNATAAIFTPYRNFGSKSHCISPVVGSYHGASSPIGVAGKRYIGKTAQLYGRATGASSPIGVAKSARYNRLSSFEPNKKKFSILHCPLSIVTPPRLKYLTYRNPDHLRGHSISYALLLNTQNAKSCSPYQCHPDNFIRLWRTLTPMLPAYGFLIIHITAPRTKAQHNKFCCLFGSKIKRIKKIHPENPCKFGSTSTDLPTIVITLTNVLRNSNAPPDCKIVPSLQRFRAPSRKNSPLSIVNWKRTR